MKKYRINPNFAELLGKHGYTMRGFCIAHNFPIGTLHAALRPNDYPDRQGGVYPKTAYRLARAWATATGQTEEQAYQQVIIEEEKPEQT